MRLKLVCVKKYKRFATRTCLDTRGPVVAIVGPNEAGKTSLLNAITHLSSEEEFARDEYTDRQRPSDWLVLGHYSLDDGDCTALGDLVDSGVDLTYLRYCYLDGTTRYWTTPAMHRDLTARRETRSLLEAAMSELRRLEADEEDVDGPNAEQGEAVLDGLESEEDLLAKETLSAMRELAEGIRAHVPEDLYGDADIPLAALLASLDQTLLVEQEPPPHRKIHDILSKRVPEVLLFGDVERDLETDYVWHEHAQPPPALDNLFALAKTDYDEFRNAAQADDRATLDTLQETANKNLDEAFKAWRQADIHVAFSADQRSLQLLVRDRASAKRSRLDERSAGLRSFVALIAFTARYGGGETSPILLIDEAETHLHYGAQADLVRVFERQRVAQSIIYTTHSIGCLPSDLGATIRVVSPIAGQLNRSRISNSFWAAQGSAGLTPVMVAMGATALAFTPSRRAVIGEGPSEAILLPSLIREALPEEERDEPLGYQVAPGISEIDPDDADDLEMEAGNVAYLIDADDGGRKHRRKISQRAKDEGRVVTLGDGTEKGLSIEDFVDAQLLVDAFNRLAERRDEIGEGRVSTDDLPTVGRAPYLDGWMRERGVRLKKAALAQEVLDLGRERGRLGGPARADQLRELHQHLLKAVEKTSVDRADAA